MKTLFALLIWSCACATSLAQQPTPSPSPSTVRRTVYRHWPRRIQPPPIVDISAKREPGADFLVGEAQVEVTKDETVIKLAMAQHGSVLIELPANDGPRYIIPGDPEMATVDEKALERNKRAIVVRPGTLFVSPLPNHKAHAPAATVTVQMRSGLVVTFLFYPVENLAQNVHRCVLSYNRDEVVARRRAAGLPVNLDVNSTSSERRDSTGQSTAPTSISVEDNGENKTAETDVAKPKEAKPEAPPKLPDDSAAKPVATPSNSQVAEVVNVQNEKTDRLKTLTADALARVTKKPKQFKNWTKPAHGLSLAVWSENDPKHEFAVVVLAVKNVNSEAIRLVSGNPDLLIEMLDEQSKPINIQSIKKLHTEASDRGDEVPGGKTVYYAIAYAAPVLGARQQVKVIVGQTNAADEPASIALSSNAR